VRLASPIPLCAGLLALALAPVAAGCGENAARAGGTSAAQPAPKVCPAKWKPGWQRIADKTKAVVYCPTWMPPPLTGELTPGINYGGAGGPIVSISRDRSYLASLIWFETGTGEIHVNFRGYPGRTTIPRCPDTEIVDGKVYRRHVNCFADPHGTVTENGITATLYTVNQGADQWHLLLAWHRGNSLYSLSEHVAKPLTYAQVLANLHHMLRSLVIVRPS
jgi:hypothetical protein